MINELETIDIDLQFSDICCRSTSDCDLFLLKVVFTFLRPYPTLLYSPVSSASDSAGSLVLTSVLSSFSSTCGFNLSWSVNTYSVIPFSESICCNDDLFSQTSACSEKLLYPYNSFIKNMICKVEFRMKVISHSSLPSESFQEIVFVDFPLY